MDSCINSNYFKADEGDECNGPKWIRQLAWDNITIDNYAVGGAYCVDTNNTHSPSVNQQTMHYINSMPDDDPATTVYVIFVGINDMVGHVRKYKDTTISIQNGSNLFWYILDPTNVLHCISTQIDRLHQAVDANQFLIFNMVPFDKSPKEAGEQAMAQAWIDQFNQQLNTTITDKLAQYKDMRMVMIDTHTIISQVLNNPENYGITQGTTDYYARTHDPRQDDNQLDNGNVYFWFDKAHMTNVVHAQLSKSIVDQNPFPNMNLMSTGGSSTSYKISPAYFVIAILIALGILYC